MSHIRTNYIYIFALLFFVDAIVLISYAPKLAISYDEAVIFFDDTGLLGELVRASADFFGRSNFAIRFPFLFFHLISTIFLFLIAQDIVKQKHDALLAVFVYMLLPGINSSALLVVGVGIVIFISLVFIFLYKRNEILAILFISVALFLDRSFMLLFLAMVAYTIYTKKYKQSIYFLFLFALSFFIFGFYTGGRPKGYFLDIFGLYGAIFSPFVFMFFIYTIYWYAFQNPKKIPLLWFVATVPFVLSILLSLRQNLPVEMFAPFAAIATPLLAVSFMNSWRVRLPRRRNTHALLFGTVFFSLVILAVLTFLHKPIYLILDKPERHFAYNYHFADELAKRLKDIGISEIKSDNEELQIRLKFYGVEEGEKYRISRKKDKNIFKEVVFQTLNKDIIVFYIYKL